MDAIATLPEIRIEVNGRQLAGEYALALRRLCVRQLTSQPACCEIDFVERYDADALVTLFRPGASLSVTVGDSPDGALFTGEVTGIDFEHGPDNSVCTHVRAHDALHRLQKHRPVRAHVDFSLAGLARELVADLGLAVEDADSATIWHHRVQHALSDLELLREISERCGQYFTVCGDVLHFFTLAGSGPARTLAYGDTLLQSRICLRTDPATRSVDVVGWDPWKMERHEMTVDAGRSAREPDDLLAPNAVGGSGHHAMRGMVIQSDDQGGCLAQAELDRSLAAEVSLWGVAEGAPGLRPGSCVEVEGLPSPLAGEFVLTCVIHTIDFRRGFTSEITTKVPERVAPRQQGASVAYGEVTQVDDPEGLGRIKVSLPTCDDIETGWLEVLLPAAGRNKGLIALPDTGDSVLLLMPEADPAQGIVLGGLYGVEPPPDSGVENGAIRRYTFVTPGGQRLSFDDDRNAVRIDTADGSHLELADEGLQIHSHADMSIAAPGRTITIRGASIQFEDG
jgi:phage baseplate assembly protein gpV/phage protein D